MADQARAAAAGLVTTVTGPVEPAAIGPTMMHEHVFIDMRDVYWDAGLCPDPELASAPLAPADGPVARWYGHGLRDNLVLDDARVAERELARYAAAGGSCLVDVTSHGLGPRPLALRAISAATGVRIVAGCGHYVHASHPDWLERADVDEIGARIADDVEHGIDGSGVLPGIVGEVGVSAVIHPCEERSVRAAARVARRHGLALSLHITSSSNRAVAAAELALAEGLDPGRLVVGHMDEILDEPTHRALLDRGAVVAFDTFGFEGGFAWRGPTDGERLALLTRLLDAGYGDRLVVSQDVAFKSQLREFGGAGYDHFLDRVAPQLERNHGIDPAVIDRLLVANPRRLLTRVPGSGA